MATNRQHAERDNLTTDQYFYYAGSSRRYYDGKFNFKLSTVMCKDCTYIPNKYCVDPKRAYQDHMKKHHRASFEREFGKEHIIHELDDTVIDAWLRSYV